MILKFGLVVVFMVLSIRDFFVGRRGARGPPDPVPAPRLTFYDQPARTVLRNRESSQKTRILDITNCGDSRVITVVTLMVGRKVFPIWEEKPSTIG